MAPELQWFSFLYSPSSNVEPLLAKQWTEISTNRAQIPVLGVNKDGFHCKWRLRRLYDVNVVVAQLNSPKYLVRKPKKRNIMVKNNLSSSGDRIMFWAFFNTAIFPRIWFKFSLQDWSGVQNPWHREWQRHSEPETKGPTLRSSAQRSAATGRRWPSLRTPVPPVSRRTSRPSTGSCAEQPRPRQPPGCWADSSPRVVRTHPRLV